MSGKKYGKAYPFWTRKVITSNEVALKARRILNILLKSDKFKPTISSV